MRAVAAVAKGRKVAPHVHAMVVPGSGVVREQAVEEGLDLTLVEARDWARAAESGREWRGAGRGVSGHERGRRRAGPAEVARRGPVAPMRLVLGK